MVRRRNEHPHDEPRRHWLEWWPGFSFGNLAILASGAVFALTLFFTFGKAFASTEENDKRHDAADVRLQDQVTANKADADGKIQRLETKIDEMNRNIVALMVAQGVKPVGSAP